MTDSSHSDTFRSARENFNQLRIEEKAEFLVEATFSTIARGLEHAGRTISREMDEFFNRMNETMTEEPPRRPSEAPGAAEAASPDVPVDPIDPLEPPKPPRPPKRDV